MKFLCTVKEWRSLELALEVAESFLMETQGMFACFEGEVWISRHTYTGRYNVWIIGGDYVPSWDELRDASGFTETPRLYQVEVAIFAKLTKLGGMKWKRFN